MSFNKEKKQQIIYYQQHYRAKQQQIPFYRDQNSRNLTHSNSKTQKPDHPSKRAAF